MKTVNTIRNTNSIHILSGLAHDIAVVVKHFGSELVSVAYESRSEVFTVRIANHKRIEDVSFTLGALDEVRVIERTTIANFEAA